VTPAAIAGVVFRPPFARVSVPWGVRKLYAMKWSDTAAAWFSTFREKAFVSRVNRRIDIRMFRFWRST